MSAIADRMPQWSTVMAFADEFLAAVAASLKFAGVKPPSYNVIQFRVEDDVVIVCAADGTQMCMVEADCDFTDVTDRDVVFEITKRNAAAIVKEIIPKESDEECDARVRVDIGESIIKVIDESSDGAGVRELEFTRLGPTLPVNPVKVLRGMYDEFSSFEDSEGGHQVKLYDHQSASLSRASKVLGVVPTLTPVDPGDYDSRVVASARGFAALYTVAKPDATGEQLEMEIDTGSASEADSSGGGGASVRVVEIRPPKGAF